MTQDFRPLESSVESECAKYAKTRGWLEVKIMKASIRGFPDRIFIRKGVVIFVEFKRDSKEEPRVQQLKRHREISEKGATVMVISDVEVFKREFR